MGKTFEINFKTNNTSKKKKNTLDTFQTTTE